MHAVRSFENVVFIDELDFVRAKFESMILIAQQLVPRTSRICALDSVTASLSSIPNTSGMVVGPPQRNARPLCSMQRRCLEAPRMPSPS